MLSTAHKVSSLLNTGVIHVTVSGVHWDGGKRQGVIPPPFPLFRNTSRVCFLVLYRPFSALSLCISDIVGRWALSQLVQDTTLQYCTFAI